jgi:hypothetical protein
VYIARKRVTWSDSVPRFGVADADTEATSSLIAKLCNVKIAADLATTLQSVGSATDAIVLATWRSVVECPNVKIAVV